MKNLTIIFLLLFASSVFSQDLTKSRKSSYYTYIYEITDAEAKSIAENGNYKIDETCLHTIIDSVKTDGFVIPDLKEGHYLKVYTAESYLYIQCFTIQNFYVDIVNNNIDLNT